MLAACFAPAAPAESVALLGFVLCAACYISLGSWRRRQSGPPQPGMCDSASSSSHKITKSLARAPQPGATRAKQRLGHIEALPRVCALSQHAASPSAAEPFLLRAVGFWGLYSHRIRSGTFPRLQQACDVTISVPEKMTSCSTNFGSTGGP